MAAEGQFEKKWCLVRNCLWRKGVKLNSSMQKELQPLMFTDTYWMFWRPNSGCEHWGSGWCISATVTATWKTSPVLDGHAQLSYKAVTDTRWRASSPAHLHESANGDDCVEKQYFVAENLLYQIVLLWSLFSFSWKEIVGITFGATYALPFDFPIWKIKQKKTTHYETKMPHYFNNIYYRNSCVL